MTGQLSEREEKFESARQRAGLVIAPVVFILLWMLPLRGLSLPAHHLLAIIGLVVSLWLTEAIPLPATALLGPSLAVLIGIAPAKESFRSFGDPIIFLYLGSFLLAEAMMAQGLNRRIAFSILALKSVARSPTRLLIAFGLMTALISMWVSNTATTAMMFPIGLAILNEMAARQSQHNRAASLSTIALAKVDLSAPGGEGRLSTIGPAKVEGEVVPVPVPAPVRAADLPFGIGLMLMTAFAASVGGFSTPVGTPPNLIGLGMIARNLQVHITFFQWMAFAVPLTIVLMAFLSWHLSGFTAGARKLMANLDEWLDAEKARLGPVTRGQKNVLFAFSVTVVLWILPGIVGVAAGTESAAFKWLNTHLPESIVSILGALLLFLLPTNFRKHQFTVTWQDATRIDWGTILLFGGGLALGELMFNTGLASWLGQGLASAFHAKTNFGMIALFTLIAIIISETTSNVASATMVVPVAIAVAQAAGTNVVQAALAATLGASMGFMLPVSTPPNAIVYGSGCVPLMKMVKYGLVLDLAGFIAIVATVTWLVPLCLKS